MTKCSVDILSVYPPPIGGISIHIKRFVHILEKKNCLYHVYDIFSKEKDHLPNVTRIRYPYLWYLKYLLFSRQKIIHAHITGIILLYVYSLLTLKKSKLIITIHSISIPNYIRKTSVFQKRIITWIINHTYKFITVNNEFRESLLTSLKPYGLNPDVIQTISPFLPPVVTDDDYNMMDSRVMPFINTHTPVISANAFMLHLHDGKQLYGIDMCVELCSRLKAQYPKIGIVVCVSVVNQATSEIYTQLMKRISELDISENMLILTGGNDFPPILSLSDVFVRPTNTDGDALSIREAISFGIPTIASDIVKRPDGCLTFKTRDLDDFENIVLRAIENHSEISQKLKQMKTTDESPLLSLYETILSEE